MTTRKAAPAAKQPRRPAATLPLLRPESGGRPLPAAPLFPGRRSWPAGLDRLDVVVERMDRSSVGAYTRPFGGAR